MTLPPWLRVLQQSPYFHVAQAAAFSALTTYMTCNPAAQTQSCAMVAGTAFLGALYLSFQKAPWSSDFKSNGVPLVAPAQIKVLADAAINPASPVTQEKAEQASVSVVH